MKKLLAFLMFCLLLPAGLAQVTGYVNDYAQLLSLEESQEVEMIARSLQGQGLAEYAVVTVASLEGQDIDSYSLSLAQGVLGDKKNNGLLLVVALQERQYRFEVGRGLEPVLPDGKIGRIGRNFLVPYFQEERYGQGIVEASRAIASTLGGEVDSAYYVQEPAIDPATIYLILFFILFIGQPLLIFFLRRQKRTSRYFNAAQGAVIILGGRHGRGGLGGGSFGGGFGGGSFGGGGASGGW